MKPSREIADLIEIMRRLRDPETGCPWDIEQSFASIAPYTIEEAYEVADAIERGDLEDLADELGDLLLQVVYHAQLGAETGAFAFGDVVQAITAKMIRRHPHVFADRTAMDPDAVNARWNEIKEQEKAARASQRRHAPADGALDGVPVALPGLARAVKLQDKASKVGFDWNDPRQVIAKMREEIDELEAELDGPRERRLDEIGDLLFAVANLARHVGVDAEAALRSTNAKFVRRFMAVERALANRGTTPQAASLNEMEALWTAAKEAERQPPGDQPGFTSRPGSGGGG